MSDETCCGACGYPVHATKESACDWCRKSADRIEAVTGKLARLQNTLDYMGSLTERLDETEAKLATCEKYRDAYAECDRIGAQAVRDLEAKLAKAVEALEDISGNGNAAGRNPQLMSDIARATLAEIKGESHD